MPCLKCCWKRKEEDVVEDAVEDSDLSSGNPRNKHALQPGHSLMDWIRLGSSGKDLTGVGARAGQLSITPRQLAQHDQADDAWIAIRGKVYNVTQYLPFHPGGADELMRGIGKDSTVLFDEVHAWVNYEKLLQKCYLGRLVAIDPSVNAEELFFGKANDSLKSPNSPVKSAASKGFTPKILLQNRVTPLDDSKSVSLNKVSSSQTKEVTKESVQANVLPRFDWIQKIDYITVIFYTKAFSNPLVEVQPPKVDNLVNICMEYDKNIFTNEIKFLKPIQWPSKIKVNYETGKVEIQFKKSQSEVWENFGVLKQKSEEASVEIKELKHKFILLNKVEVNYNTALLELQRLDETKIAIPIGKHIRVFGNKQLEDISRSYTPVPYSLFSKYKPQQFVTDNICLMVKSYPNGGISKYICGKKKGDMIEVSQPIGSFSLSKIQNRETFILLAAGTGITPMLGLLLFLLDRRIRKCQNVTLLFFNRTKEDILIESHLDVLQNEDSRLKVKHILSRPDANWDGLKGQVSQEILQNAVDKHLLNTVYKQSDIFLFVCGPTPFTNLSYTFLTDIGFTQEQIHLFLG